MAQINAKAAKDMSWLVKAAALMLQPVARLLVGKLSCTVAVNLLKQAYIQEARRMLRANDPNKRITMSALGLLTGLDTRAVAALDGLPERGPVSASELCPEAAVLNAWFTQKTYHDQKTGKPLVLPIYGRGISFQTLVTRNAGRNVTCPTVLERLTESGNLKVEGDNHVRLVSPHYVPVNSSEQTVIEVGSASMNRLGKTIAHNMEADERDSKWLQQDRWSRRIPPDQVEPLRQRLRETLTEQIERIESDLDSAEDPVKQSNHQAVGIGWFYWEDPDQ
jgi:hypothetical protein